MLSFKTKNFKNYVNKDFITKNVLFLNLQEETTQSGLGRSRVWEGLESWKAAEAFPQT